MTKDTLQRQLKLDHRTKHINSLKQADFHSSCIFNDRKKQHNYFAIISLNAATLCIVVLLPKEVRAPVARLYKISACNIGFKRLSIDWHDADRSIDRHISEELIGGVVLSLGFGMNSMVQEGLFFG